MRKVEVILSKDDELWMDIKNFCDKMMMLTVRTKNPKILVSKKEEYMSLYREDRL